MNNPEIVARVEAVLKEYNPCGIHEVAGEGIRCNGESNNFRPCCNGCKWLRVGGCTVNSIACKFYFCKSSWAKLPKKIQKELREIIPQYTGELRFRFDGFVIPQRSIILYCGIRS